MNRLTIALVAGLSLVSTISGVARAQPLPPGQPGEPRCRTTTTTECTGTAAQYAVPYTDPPAYPPQAPQPYPPPQAYPPSAYPPPPAYPPPGAYGAPAPFMPTLRLGDGWRTVVDQNGQLVVERRTRLGRTGLWAAGLTLFVGMPLVSGIGLALDGGARDKELSAGLSFLPVLGPWINAGIARDSYSYVAYDCIDYCSRPDNSGRIAGWAIAGLVQASGLVMFLVGLGTGPEKVERFPLRFSAGPTQNGGAQFGAYGKF